MRVLFLFGIFVRYHKKEYTYICINKLKLLFLQEELIYMQKIIKEYVSALDPDPVFKTRISIIRIPHFENRIHIRYFKKNNAVVFQGSSVSTCVAGVVGEVVFLHLVDEQAVAAPDVLHVPKQP